MAARSDRLRGAYPNPNPNPNPKPCPEPNNPSPNPNDLARLEGVGGGSTDPNDPRPQFERR